MLLNGRQFNILETWLSGRKYLTANEASCKRLRGFESLRLRQIGNFEPKQNNGFWAKMKIMAKLLTKKEAIEFLGLDDKTFDNYFKNAAEFPCVDRNGGRGRFYFDEDILRK